MAIDGKLYSGKEVKLGIAQESVFGTAIAHDAAFVQIAEFGSVSVNHGLKQEIPVRNRGVRMAHTDDVFVAEHGQTKVITISDIVFRQKDLPEFLYAIFQNVTEAVASPFLKTYVGWSAQPDFAAYAGYFCTIGIDNPIASRDEIYVSCICKELKLSADLIGGDGRIRGDATFISGFNVNKGATFSGTWTPNTQNYFDSTKLLQVLINEKNIVLYGWELTINNNAVRVGCSPLGSAQTYAIGIPEIEITGSITCKYDDNTQDALDDFIAGTERDNSLIIGNVAAAGYFKLDLKNSVYTGLTPEQDKAEGMAITIPFKCLYDGTNYPEILVTDGLDQTW